MWDWNFESTQMRKTGRTERDSDTEATRKLADRDDMLIYMHAFALHIFISTMLEIVLRK